MAKASKETENTEAGGEAGGEEVAAEAKTDKRHKIIRDPEGNEVKRTDYIRSLWSTGNYTRGEIRDHLKSACSSDDGSHDIKYQIVNAAVKDQPGGPSTEHMEALAKAKEDAKAAKAAKAAAAKAAEASEKASTENTTQAAE